MNDPILTGVGFTRPAHSDSSAAAHTNGCNRCHMADQHNTEILFARHGVAGVVTLNRPQALNAVTHTMVRALGRQLAEWSDDPAITRVLVTAAGGRAFSAGGDLRQLHKFWQQRRIDDALSFWRDEY